MIGFEAAGHSIHTDRHAASIMVGSRACFMENHTYGLQDEGGHITNPRSISAGVDYPGIGPS